MKISIVIVVYNADKWLKECIESAVNQTMSKSDYEILIINNGSTDNSSEIINEYNSQYDNVKVFIEEENKRPTIIYNKYLKVAKGEYIHFMHSDDIMSKYLASLCYELMHEKKLDLVFYGWKSFYRKGYDIEKNRFIVKHKEKITSTIPANKIFSGKEIFIQEQWLGSEFAFVFDRKFLINNSLFFIEKLLYWDLDFIPKVLMKAKKVMRIDEILYYYRLRKDYSSPINYDPNIIYIKNTLYELGNFVRTQDKSDKKLMDSFKIYFHNHFSSLIMNLEKKFDCGEREVELIKEYEEYFKVLRFAFGEKSSFERIPLILKEMEGIFKGNIIKEKDFIGRLDSYCNYNIQRKMSRIPFSNKVKKIGIYGIGQHTDYLIKLYSYYINDIKANIFFFDSFMDDEIYNGNKIINIKNINSFNLDCVVISSPSHEKELYDNINKIMERDIEIFTFYNNYNI